MYISHQYQSKPLSLKPSKSLAKQNNVLLAMRVCDEVGAL
jgi:hypothetical protein